MAKKLVLIVMITMTLVVGVFVTKPLIFAIISQYSNIDNSTNNDIQSHNNEQEVKQDIQEAKSEPQPEPAPIVSTPEPEPKPQPIPVEQPSSPKPAPKPAPVEQPSNPKPAPQPVQVAPKPEVKEATKELEVLRLVNIERQKAGKKPLKYLSALEQGANIRALEIIDLWSHTRPDGTRFVTAFDYIQYAKIGENLASGCRTPQDVVALWMSSDSHRQNILSDKYEHMAIAVSKNEQGRLYWIQVLYQGK